MVSVWVAETWRDRAQHVTSHQDKAKPCCHSQAGCPGCPFNPCLHRWPDRHPRRGLAAKLDRLAPQKLLHGLGACVLRKLNRVDKTVAQTRLRPLEQACHALFLEPAPPPNPPTYHQRAAPSQHPRRRRPSRFRQVQRRIQRHGHEGHNADDPEQQHARTQCQPTCQPPSKTLENASNHSGTSLQTPGFSAQGPSMPRMEGCREIRRPKPEGRMEAETRSANTLAPSGQQAQNVPKRRALLASAPGSTVCQTPRVALSDFGLRTSDFELRISAFISAPPSSSATTPLPANPTSRSSTTIGPKRTAAGGQFAARLPSAAPPRACAPHPPPSLPRRH